MWAWFINTCLVRIPQIRRSPKRMKHHGSYHSQFRCVRWRNANWNRMWLENNIEFIKLRTGNTGVFRFRGKRICCGSFAQRKQPLEPMHELFRSRMWWKCVINILLAFTFAEHSSPFHANHIDAQLAILYEYQSNLWNSICLSRSRPRACVVHVNLFG